MSNTNLFRCKVYEPVFKNVINSYKGIPFKKHVVLKGGGASGKSEHVGHEIVFWLPENVGDEALIITYSQEHRKNTINRFKRILTSHGYEFVESRGSLLFGNGNKINFMSLASKSKMEEKEKLKTFTLENANALKFIWFEEFTAIIGLFNNYHEYFYAVSRLFRETTLRSMVFYCYNPLPSKVRHPISEFNSKEEEDKLFIHSTIYDLPKKFQSEQDLKEAEELERTDKDAFNNIYLGLEIVGRNQAFDVSDDIYTDLADDYIDLQVFTDEGTVNATTFSLIGRTRGGEVHYITNYYYSSKVTGVMKSPSDFADDYVKFVGNLKGKLSKERTDSIAFAMELKKKGVKAKSIHSQKDRVLSYKLLHDLHVANKFKIVRAEENNMLKYQMENAEKEYNQQGKPMISKKNEGGMNNETHTHALDTILYYCLDNYDTIVKKR